MTTRRTTSFTTSAFGRITPSLSSASASSTTTAATTAVSSPFTAGGTSPAHSLFTFCPRDGRPFQDGEFMCPWCNVSRDPAQFAADKAGSGGSLGEDTPKWRKLLYVQQPFPDNHVDGSFLEELQRNVNVRAYDYWELVRHSGSITQQGSSIVLFAIIFIHSLTGLLPAAFLVGFSSSTSLVGYLIWFYINPQQEQPLWLAAQGAILFVCSLLGLSPILRTLTEHTSSDTVWALTSILFFANLLLHDYTSVTTFPGALSLNAAISGSVMLASRLPSTLHVFGLMLLAIEWFALFPMFRRYLHWFAPQMTTKITVSMVLLTTALLVPLSTTITILYAGFVLFVTFVCPYWLLWMQRYKNEIHGPWDEATLSVSVAQQD